MEGAGVRVGEVGADEGGESGFGVECVEGVEGVEGEVEVGYCGWDCWWELSEGFGG